MRENDKLPETIKLEKLGMEQRQAKYIGDELNELKLLFQILKEELDKIDCIVDERLNKIEKKLKNDY